MIQDNEEKKAANYIFIAIFWQNIRKFVNKN